MEIFNEWWRKYYGLNPYRQSINVRKDAFYQFLPNNTPADLQVLARLSKTITHLSDDCFKQCSDPKYPFFTHEQQECIRRCTQNYFKGFEELTLITNRTIKSLNNQYE